jgi:flagellar export protein FliJ
LLLEARQRREALEKMRDKKQTLHQYEARRTEQNAIDEMVLLREASGLATKF